MGNPTLTPASSMLSEYFWFLDRTKQSRFSFLSINLILNFGFVVRLKVNGAGGGQKGLKKTGKDPNKPKRPASAFFVFM